MAFEEAMVMGSNELVFEEILCPEIIDWRILHRDQVRAK